MPLEIYRNGNRISLFDASSGRASLIVEGNAGLMIDGDQDMARSYLGTRRGFLDLEADYTAHHRDMGYTPVQAPY
ncbi:MAG: hypothetical protein HZB67_06255 [Candidatus Aenigmarchaeota archaeon]|nr:hypothetical protein [Candidatus Aenigmarchaeota archaeon]